MEIHEMDSFIKKTRHAFRDCLDNGLRKCAERVAIRALKSMCGEFEENVLIENLQEEYGLYLKSLAA